MHEFACLNFPARLLGENRDIALVILQAAQNLSICSFARHKSLGVRSKIIELVYKAFAEVSQ